MKSELDYLKVIAENTDSNHMLRDIEDRLGQLELQMGLAIDYLRDIAMALTDDD